MTVGTFERKHGLASGTLRREDGRDLRSDKLLGTLRTEAARQARAPSDSSRRRVPRIAARRKPVD
jgi:hypothetical protein